jgi:hypothetical protein
MISREKEKKFGEILPQCFFSFTHHESNEKSPSLAEHETTASTLPSTRTLPAKQSSTQHFK